MQRTLSKARELKLTWPLPPELSDSKLEALIYPNERQAPSAISHTPNWNEVHLELKRKGITKQLLWEEYKQQYPNNSFGYSQYCDRYREWQKKQKRSMRQVHKAGDKTVC